MFIILAAGYCSNFAFWCTRQYTAWHHVISTNCASQFRLLLTILFSVPLAVVICSFPGQDYNSATGHFVWLVQSNGTVSHWTLVPHLHYQLLKTCSRHIFSRVPTSLTNCFAEYEERTLYGALTVTLAMSLRLINCRFIIIIIIIIPDLSNGNRKGLATVTKAATLQ